ncbi:MAG: nucleotidyl transferase AbiEii/AbiGii toxin family protein [Gammaproteobacteria bacterium]|nr:nucleotidyl transferase AbiEii/AbiGii toxin family protein [Gammaproteobacteria bacterium]
MKLSDSQILHEKVIRSLCKMIHEQGKPLVLKGGTALRMCYGLDRFSEDIDLDSAVKLNLESFLAQCAQHIGKSVPEMRNATIDTKKDTAMVSRYILRYADNQDRRLKIEVSRRSKPDEKVLAVVDGILTYTVTELIRQKVTALQERTAARDLHDVIFLAKNYCTKFSDKSWRLLHSINDHQADTLSRFTGAYDEDSILTVADLLNDLIALQTCMSTT